MEVLNQTQKVIDLLEEDIKNVDYSKIAKLTGIPIGLYQRIFTYICNISLSSYVRRRRLTLSAEMLLRKEESITQVAMEWGYENSSAFTRAFKEQFTVPPACITREIYLKHATFPLSMTNRDTYYVLEGKRVMADIKRLEYEETEDVLLIGISSRDYKVTTKELWGIFWEQGFDKVLHELRDNYIGMEDCIGLGYMTDFADDTGLGKTYIVGKYFKVGTPIPKGMMGKIIKGGTIAKAQIAAKSLEEIINNAYILIASMVQKNGYSLLYDDFYWLEFYTVSRFCEPLEQGADELILDFHMPCMKQKI